MFLTYYVGSAIGALWVACAVWSAGDLALLKSCQEGCSARLDANSYLNLNCSLDLNPETEPFLQPYTYSPSTLVGTDNLGRVLPTAGAVGPLKQNTTVGMFYFIWHTLYDNDQEGAGLNGGPYDNSRIVAAAGGQINSAQYGPVGTFHHWGESIFGYYLTDDTWVLRKQATMMTDALVDYIMIDTSNTFIYPTYLTALLDTWASMRLQGSTTPSVTFLLIADPETTFQTLHEQFYSQPQWSSLWFIWEGKPLIYINNTLVNSSLWNLYTFRATEAFTGADQSNNWFGTGPDAGQDRWPWIDLYPQGCGWHISPSIKEYCPVAVGGWPAFSIGRSYDGPTQTQPPFNFNNQSRAAYGHYFQQQYSHILGGTCSDYSFQCSGVLPNQSPSLPDVIFVTGWNEWIANRYVVGSPAIVGNPQPFCTLLQTTGETVFVDEFCEEFSRDIEPMMGGHSDNYLMQLIALNRWYKGMPTQSASSQNQTIATGRSDFTAWKTVTPQYGDTVGDNVIRSHPGFGSSGLYYTDYTATDDLCQAQVTTDSQALYFRVGICGGYWSANTPEISLYIKFDGVAAPTAMGYHFKWSATANSLYEPSSIVGVEWAAITGGALFFSYDQVQLHVAVPYPLLGSVTGWTSLEFKWWVGAEQGIQFTDPVQFLIWGDAAPNGRLNYAWAPYSYPSVGNNPGLAGPTASTPFVQPSLTSIQTCQFQTFASPALAVGAYDYTPATTAEQPWTWQYIAGIAAVGSAFDPGQPDSPPGGGQFAFMQLSSGSNIVSNVMTTTLNGIDPSASYILSFYWGLRGDDETTNITLSMTVDGVVVWKSAPNLHDSGGWNFEMSSPFKVVGDGSPFAISIASPILEEGSVLVASILVSELSPSAQGSSNSVTLTKGWLYGFDAPIQQYDGVLPMQFIESPPASPLQPWTFQGTAGIANQGSSYDPTPYHTVPPSCNSYAFLQVSAVGQLAAMASTWNAQSDGVQHTATFWYNFAYSPVYTSTSAVLQMQVNGVKVWQSSGPIASMGEWVLGTSSAFMLSGPSSITLSVVGVVNGPQTVLIDSFIIQ